MSSLPRTPTLISWFRTAFICGTILLSLLAMSTSRRIWDECEFVSDSFTTLMIWTLTYCGMNLVHAHSSDAIPILMKYTRRNIWHDGILMLIWLGRFYTIKLWRIGDISCRTAVVISSLKGSTWSRVAAAVVVIQIIADSKGSVGNCLDGCFTSSCGNCSFHLSIVHVSQTQSSNPLGVVAMT